MGFQIIHTFIEPTIRGGTLVWSLFQQTTFMYMMVTIPSIHFSPWPALQLTIILKYCHMSIWRCTLAAICQARSHEIWSSPVALKGVMLPSSGIEACNIDYSTQSTEKKCSPSFLSYQDGLSWHLRASKTRKCCFQTICSHQSLLCQLWPRGCQPVCRVRRWIREYWQKCGCHLKKWSGWNRTNLTGGYGPVCGYGKTQYKCSSTLHTLHHKSRLRIYVQRRSWFWHPSNSVGVVSDFHQWI